MNPIVEESLQSIDSLWQLHQHRDPEAGVAGRCLAFVVDPRYVNLPAHDPELFFRVGASFGHNPFTPQMATGFVPPPVLPGDYVFGLHLIASKGPLLTLYDQWMDAHAAGDCDSPESGAERARAILASIADDEYLQMVKEDPQDEVLLQVSEYYDLDHFQIVDAEAF